MRLWQRLLALAWIAFVATLFISHVILPKLGGQL